ncbi:MULTISPECIES: YdeI family protein [unclassified Isoptericola]|uniref:YdeI/OmpD-associated family protein n=1 Tax=unclassified Isoptericola TaxID=2623355 RepID=UPI002714162C|nr:MULTISPECIES: YdeI/OmpD-associated family protein [unclassified Isoptericola]MDO8144062.1 YdeI/OmpD-associated family protein [Isoptericola sp. 178]MDO8149475.1 YdeI/OmpD-associated family protein [Isoptericola sp. b515]MDO8152421.1 YdeI/OmpD-associated family protein [Isoptericola sp. b408]
MATEPSDPLLLPDAAAWRAWLDAHEDDTPEGVWVVLARKARPAPTSLTRDEALEEALCSGWIDAQARSRDTDTSLQRYCPRRRRSSWSARNREIVDRLVAQGRMRPRGQAEVDRAREDGRWEAAYGGAATLEVPPVWSRALAASPRATAAWELLTAQNRSAILHRLATVVRDETRERHAARFVAMLERGETPHPQRRGTLPAE